MTSKALLDAASVAESVPGFVLLIGAAYWLMDGFQFWCFTARLIFAL